MRKKTQKVYCIASRYGQDVFWIHKFVCEAVRDTEIKNAKLSRIPIATWEEVDTWE